MKTPWTSLERSWTCSTERDGNHLKGDAFCSPRTHTALTYKGQVRPPKRGATALVSKLHLFFPVTRGILVEAKCYGSLPNNVSALFQRLANGERAVFEKENYLVAEEKGVEGRLNHHVMHTLQHVAEVSRLSNVQLGDFKATSESRQVGQSDSMPDMTVMSKDTQECRVLGECKADWDSLMLRNYRMREGKGQSKEFRKWLSKCFTNSPFETFWCSFLPEKIGSYLWGHKCKYGFVTTYLYTVFVWYPHQTSDQKQDFLYVSRPIPYHEKYQAQTAGPVRLSVRQAIWYLMLKGNGPQSEWQMTEGDSEQDTSRLGLADASGSGSGGGGGGGTSRKKSRLGQSPSSAAQQPCSGVPPGTTYASGSGGGRSELPSRLGASASSAAQRPSSGGLLGTTYASGSGDGRSELPSRLGASASSAAKQPSSGGPLATTYASVVNRARPEPLTRDQWKRLQPAMVVSQNISGRTEEWRMQPKRGGPTKPLELRNVVQRIGPRGELAVVYSDKTGAYLLNVPNSFKAFLAQRQVSSGQQSSNDGVTRGTMSRLTLEQSKPVRKSPNVRSL